ncbi:hypothetical protein Taro_002627, partial [Colocasia esculenta]|nr:hypothetical protein [Colocasia esculenta]
NGIGRSLNSSLKPSWSALARAKRFLDQEERPRGGEFVERKDLSSSSPSSSSFNPRRVKRSKVRPRMNHTLKRTGTIWSDVMSTLVSYCYV